jgi:hypothetical protein
MYPGSINIHPLGGGRGGSGSSIEAAHSTGAAAQKGHIVNVTTHNQDQDSKYITDFFKSVKKNAI